MVNPLIQLLPNDCYGDLSFSIWWSSNVQLIGHCFLYAQGRELCKNGLRIIGNIWHMKTKQFILWQKVKSKFNLKDNEDETWDLITHSIMNKRHGILKRDNEKFRMGLWIGFFTDHYSDLIIVLKNKTTFDSQCIKNTIVTFLIPVQCFKVGHQSRCLHEWEKPKGSFEGTYDKIKIVKTTRGQKNKRSCAFMGRGLHLLGILKDGFGKILCSFWTILTR